VRPGQRPVPDGREGDHGPDARAAVYAGVPTVPGQERHPDARQHGRTGRLWVHVSVQRLHVSGPR